MFPLRRRQYSCTPKVVEFTNSPIHRAIFKQMQKSVNKSVCFGMVSGGIEFFL